jgi:hypothetical protein
VGQRRGAPPVVGILVSAGKGHGRTFRVVATVCVAVVGALSFIVLIESVTGFG